ncbi:hypothetical protein D3C80_1612790 [compost metagenome]
MPIAQQHFEGLPGDLVLALDRLIGVGVGAQIDRRALIAAFGQLLLQHIDSVGLGDQFGFEIQPRRHVPVSVARPRVTINAAVFATAIGVD